MRISEKTDGEGAGTPRAGSFCLSPGGPDPSSDSSLRVSGQGQADAQSPVLEFLGGGPRLRHSGCVHDTHMPPAETGTQKLFRGGAKVQVPRAAGRAGVHAIRGIRGSDQAFANGVVPPRPASAWVVQLPAARSAVQAARPPGHSGPGALAWADSSLPGQPLQTPGVGREGLGRQREALGADQSSVVGGRASSPPRTPRTSLDDLRGAGQKLKSSKRHPCGRSGVGVCRGQEGTPIRPPAFPGGPLPSSPVAASWWVFVPGRGGAGPRVRELLPSSPTPGAGAFTAPPMNG